MKKCNSYFKAYGIILLNGGSLIVTKKLIYKLKGLIFVEKNLFKWKHFESEIILVCVRWYLKYPLSYILRY